MRSPSSRRSRKSGQRHPKRRGTRLAEAIPPSKGTGLPEALLDRVIASAPIKIDDDPVEAERLAVEVRREMRWFARRPRR